MNTNYDKWAGIYDSIYYGFKQDISFYVKESVKINGQVLEIGCGTGRITFSLAANPTINVTGIDISPQMIKTVDEKAKQKYPNLETHVMDMRNITINKKYDRVIIPFNGFQAMLNVNDQISCLHSIKNVLKNDSKLILDMFIPNIEMFDQENNRYYHASSIQSKNISIWHKSNFNSIEQTINTTIKMSEYSCNGKTSHYYNEYQLRYTYMQEAAYLFERCGYKITSLYGDFNKSKFDNNSDKMVWILKPSGDNKND
jgi:ubiquinone/menaquinone biosynthesis C-methylase UbiE